MKVIRLQRQLFDGFSAVKEVRQMKKKRFSGEQIVAVLKRRSWVSRWRA